jgi:GNAT superfamily N-acetyltransferase
MVMRYSTKELARAAARNYIDLFISAYASPPKPILWQQPDMVLYDIGSKCGAFNGVLRARLTADSMERRVCDAQTFFKKRRRSWTWSVDPETTPRRLGDYLVRKGFVPDWEIPCMAIDLGKVRRKPLPEGLRILRVEDLKSLRTCINTLDIALASPEYPDREPLWDDAYMSFGIGLTKNWFLGLLNDKPVATSFLFLHQGVAGIYFVVTMQKARGRGIGTAMTREALLLAKKLRYDFAVIQASKMGLPVYERMGFKEYCKIRKYNSPPK